MSTKGGAMNALPYLAGLAARHAWAGREFARVQADIVEARLTARALARERAARRRARLRALRPALPVRLARPVRRPEPVHCRRAAARSVRIARPAGGAR
ncbi:hypothetical protein [Actinomadura nitritigenes]|uniref:hypothetical protein n=1 Tax=Actinomadura nitritigenes TaxID=134602 RepID=UPI003D909897